MNLLVEDIHHRRLDLLVLLHVPLPVGVVRRNQRKQLVDLVFLAVGDVGDQRALGSGIIENEAELLRFSERVCLVEPLAQVCQSGLLDDRDDLIAPVLVDEIARRTVDADGDDQQRGDARGREHRGAAFFRSDTFVELLDGGCAILSLEGQTAHQRLVLALVELCDGLGLEFQLFRFRRRLLAVGMFSGEQLVGHDGEGINVVPRIGIRALEHFQRGVGGRQRAEFAGVEQRGFPLGVGLGFGCPRDAEIEQLDGAVLGVEAVAGLEVRVHQSVGVGVGQTVAQLLDQRHGLFHAQAAGGQPADERVQRLAFQHLHGHEDGVG